jgi:hypothetical protein
MSVSLIGGSGARVPIGYDCFHVTVFATLEDARAHSSELWWLYLSRCSACGQYWMVAHDDRIYDDIFLKRLDPDAAEQIVATGVWPVDFLTYERVLALGRTMSRPPQFFEPFGSLQSTVDDLLKARPTIAPKGIADLLGMRRCCTGRCDCSARGCTRPAWRGVRQSSCPTPRSGALMSPVAGTPSASP